jgi:hypothetical protein
MIEGMDVNTLAYKIVQQSIGEAPVTKPDKRRAKGGTARAESLTANQRKKIAKKAARSRWAAKGTSKG